MEKDRGGQCTDDILKLCFGNITFKKPNMEKRAFWIICGQKEVLWIGGLSKKFFEESFMGGKPSKNLVGTKDFYQACF